MIPTKENALREQGVYFKILSPHYSATPNIEPMFVSGFGQFHTNEPDVENPNKKLTPYTTIALPGIRALVDNPQSVDKAGGQWLIASTLPCRTFATQEQSGEFWMLWADLDKEPKALDEVAEVLDAIIPGCDREQYTSRSAQENNPKSRILIPLIKPLCGGDFLLCQEVLNDKLAERGLTPDRATERAGQLCYLPNRGDFYQSLNVRDGSCFDPLTEWALEIAAKRAAIAEHERVLHSEAQAAAIRREALKLDGDNPDLIGAFNAAYTVQDILVRAGYKQRGNTFRHPLSESGSYSASVKNGRVHSMSSSDPLYTGGGGVGAHDAFSAFCLLFAGGDQSAALKLAGEQWLSIAGESWNTVQQRDYMRRKAAEERSDRSGSAGAAAGDRWPDPTPIPDALPFVMPFDPEILPDALRPWLEDIAERVQCPPDFPAVGAMISLAAVVGRKVGIRPKRKDDWLEVPNLWGAIVGRPGVMKSPALREVMKPLRVIEGRALATFEDEAREWARSLELAKLKREASKSKVLSAYKKGMAVDPDALNEDLPDDGPHARRYVVNDCTVEALGEILRYNPNGTLAYRDELISLLKSLDKEGNEGARGFFLSAWSGTDGYTFDRIGRGLNMRIEACCVSLLGSIQPAIIGGYLRQAVAGGGGDGLLSRFQLLVWPDIAGEWRDVDRWPDTNAKALAYSTFERLDTLDPAAIGATVEDGGIPYLRFDEAAQKLFSEWRNGFEHRIRSGNDHAAFEAHLSKYRKLVPAMALLIHLADDPGRAISELSLLKSLSWAEYLESHARRAYASVTQAEAEGARALLNRIRRGEVSDPFVLRDVYLKHWAYLSTPEDTRQAVRLLCDLDYLREDRVETGGRPRQPYRINPKARAA
ncbi:MAG: YfjI family protein [Betaproteobacteria bacterium]